VLGGVITSTFLVTIFAPLFYVLIQKTLGKRRVTDTAASTGTNSSVNH